MTTKEFNIDGMTCMHCVKGVEMELKELEAAEFHVEIGNAKVTYDETKLTEKDIVNAIEEAGYKVKN